LNQFHRDSAFVQAVLEAFLHYQPVETLFAYCRVVDNHDPTFLDTLVKTVDPNSIFKGDTPMQAIVRPFHEPRYNNGLISLLFPDRYYKGGARWVRYSTTRYYLGVPLAGLATRLIVAGADTNKPDRFGITPREWVEFGRLGIINIPPIAAPGINFLCKICRCIYTEKTKSTLALFHPLRNKWVNGDVQWRCCKQPFESFGCRQCNHSVEFKEELDKEFPEEDWDQIPKHNGILY